MTEPRGPGDPDRSARDIAAEIGTTHQAVSFALARVIRRLWREQVRIPTPRQRAAGCGVCRVEAER